jgi:hypothetical protein
VSVITPCSAVTTLDPQNQLVGALISNGFLAATSRVWNIAVCGQSAQPTNYDSA